MGTQKVSEARRRKHIKIVRPEWLYHSIGKWQRQSEADYVLPELAYKSSPASTTPPHNPEDEKNFGGAEGNEEEDQGGVSEDMGTIQTINNDVWEDAAKELEDELGDLDDTDFDSDTRLATLFFGSMLFIRGFFWSNFLCCLNPTNLRCSCFSLYHV